MPCATRISGGRSRFSFHKSGAVPLRSVAIGLALVVVASWQVTAVAGKEEAAAARSRSRRQRQARPPLPKRSQPTGLTA